MKNKVSIILIVTLVILSAVIIFQNIFVFNVGNDTHEHPAEEELYTCGMHLDIISEEPGNCPICEMKLTPIKSKKSASGEKQIIYWRAPMDPNEIYDAPGKSKMGMDLVPVYEYDEGTEGIVTIDPVVVQNMNVKIEKVVKRKLSNKIVTNGILTTNEINDFTVTTKVNGWVEKLYINFLGQKVNKGEKLMDVYSPELVAAQKELLTSLAYKNSVSESSIKNIKRSGNELIKNAVRKLQLLEMSDSDINRLKETNEVKTYVTLYAPKNGTVIAKNITEGQKIVPGKPLLQMTDLSTLWLIADIYEYELSKIELGSKASIKFNYMPSNEVTGQVSFIYPTIDAKTRTAKIRIDINNEGTLLKPAMLANVVITGKDLGKYPVVPENSILRGGKRDIIIIALGDGKFKPQEVILGAYSDSYYQIISGLVHGTKIVTSAQFLIDSESNLKAAIKQFSSTNDPNDEEQTDNMRNEMTNMNSPEKFDPKNDAADMDYPGHDYSIMSTDEMESSIIREGVIDLKSIDKNGDGMVYQDLMDWNVISDKPGRCPICEMKLSEVTIQTAKKNLTDNNFQVK